MVIFFLISTRRLPKLAINVAEDSVGDGNAGGGTTYPNLGDLVLSFFCYWRDFQYFADVASVRLGRVCKITETPVGGTNSPRSFVMEDPCEPEYVRACTSASARVSISKGARTSTYTDPPHPARAPRPTQREHCAHTHCEAPRGGQGRAKSCDLLPERWRRLQ